nr:glutamate receptor ionotropic, kainate 2-like [Procambarus clarkii]
MSWELMLTLARYFNFTPVPLLVEDNMVGLRDPGGKWRGVIDLLHRKVAEVTLLPVTVTKHREEVLDFSLLLGTTTFGFLVKRPYDTPKTDALLKPFTYQVWWMILVATVAMGPLMYSLIIMRKKVCEKDTVLNRVFPLDECMWFVYGSMMRQGTELKPISDSSRILFATWWLFITIVTSFYTANLTAFLTFNGLQLHITRVEDLRKHHVTWLAFRDGALVEVISTHPKLQILRDLQAEGRGRFIDSRAEAVSLVRTNDYVYIDDMQVLDHLMQEDFKTQRRVGAKETCSFYSTPLASGDDVDFVFWFGYGFRKGSDLTPLFNGFFRRLAFFGILNFLHDNVTSNSPICTMPKGFKDRSLQNKDFYTTYVLGAIGIVLAAGALGCECLVRRARRCRHDQDDLDADYPTTHLPDNVPSILGVESIGVKHDPIWGSANLPPLPDTRARTPFHVRYPQYSHGRHGQASDAAFVRP